MAQLCNAELDCCENSESGRKGCKKLCPAPLPLGSGAAFKLRPSPSLCCRYLPGSHWLTVSWPWLTSLDLLCSSFFGTVGLCSLSLRSQPLPSLLSLVAPGSPLLADQPALAVLWQWLVSNKVIPHLNSLISPAEGNAHLPYSWRAGFCAVLFPSPLLNTYTHAQLDGDKLYWTSTQTLVHN